MDCPLSEYPIAGEYKDSSKDILNELGVKIDDDECDDCEGDSDCEVESEDDENVILVVVIEQCRVQYSIYFSSSFIFACYFHEPLGE